MRGVITRKMVMRISYFIFLLIIFGATLNIGAEEKSDPILLLKWVEKANPVLNAKDALRKGDYRLMAIYGFTISIPGLDSRNMSRLISTNTYFSTGNPTTLPHSVHEPS